MKTIASAAILAALSTTAYAAPVDAQAFAERLRDEVQKDAGFVLEWRSVASDVSGNVVFDGASLKRIGSGWSIPIRGTATFYGVEGSTASGWNVSSFSVADFTSPPVDGSVSASVSGLGGSGFRLASSEEGLTLPTPWRAGASSVSFSIGGRDIALIRDVAFAAGTPAGSDTSRDILANVTILSDAWKEKDPTAALPAYLSAIGYDTVNGDVSLRTNHDPSRGMLRTLFEIDADPAYLKISTELEGAKDGVLTPLAAALGVAGTVPSQKDVLAAMSSLGWKDGSVVYEDRGLVGRISSEQEKAGVAAAATLRDQLLAAAEIAPLDTASKKGLREGIEKASAGDGGVRLEAHPSVAVSLAQVAMLALTQPALLPAALALTVTPAEPLRPESGTP